MEACLCLIITSFVRYQYFVKVQVNCHLCLRNCYRLDQNSPVHRRLLLQIYISLFCFSDNTFRRTGKTLIETSRECHNRKPQPTADTTRKRKRSKIYTCKKKKTNARETQTSRVITMLNTTYKHENKDQGKTQHETARSKKHKATQNRYNTMTTALNAR